MCGICLNEIRAMQPLCIGKDNKIGAYEKWRERKKEIKSEMCCISSIIHGERPAA